MLRPERMSRVSVTGTKRVMVDVIEAVHDLDLVHFVDYDGGWAGFDPGDPIDPAEDASERLVTVRSIESILGVDEDPDLERDATAVSDEEIEAELADVRSEVNNLDDRRTELRESIRSLEERAAAAEPLVDVGIDLDLLSGYESLAVRVGEGDADAVRGALADADAVDAFEVFAGERAVAAFVHPADQGLVDDALVGVGLAATDVPDAEGSPAAYVDDLEEERERLEDDLANVEAAIAALKEEAAHFLLAADAHLSVQVQKAEAPLHFATTENAFLAEGWIPSDRVDDLERAVESAADDRAEVEELERADYDRHGHPSHDGGEQTVAADGGTDVAMADRGPPVIQDNPGPTRPFEVLVQTISRPSYFELDPTIVLFLTLPVFFGLMIGDVGYGLLYLLVGYGLWRRFDTPGFRGLGGVFMWAGAATVVFGIFYGEFLGSHVVAELLWAGHAPLHKGIETEFAPWAQMWLVVALLVGLVHLTTGFVFDFRNRLSHGLGEAVTESGSWLLLMLGVWVWIFSRSGASRKPDFLYTVFAGEPLHLGFTGLPASVGVGGLVVALVGLVMLIRNEGLAGVVESLNVLTHVLSYSRLTAEILAEVGIAFVVNLLVFGAEGFPGLFHVAGVLGLAFGVIVFVLGHFVVLALGVLSAGMQAIRLEYVEFFSKFYYAGGTGEPYEPFGAGRAR